MTEDDLLAGIQKLSGFVLGYISSTDHDEAAACRALMLASRDALALANTPARLHEKLEASPQRIWNALMELEEHFEAIIRERKRHNDEFHQAVGAIEAKFAEDLRAKQQREEHQLTDPAVRKQVFNLTGGKCAYCDTQLVESGGEQDQFCIEHVVPSSMGGPNHLVNYVPSCRSCNNSKGDRHVLYFIRNSFVLRNRAAAPVSPITPIAEAAE